MRRPSMKDCVVSKRLSQSLHSVDLERSTKSSSRTTLVVRRHETHAPTANSAIMMRSEPPSKRTRVVREPQRGVYERDACYAILDDALLCHVGFEVERQPFVIPTMFARVGDRIYFHGSAASRMLRHLGNGAAACITVTLLDGIVLARSVFNHSMNYRSVVALGNPRAVADPGEKRAALKAFTENRDAARRDVRQDTPGPPGRRAGGRKPAGVGGRHPARPRRRSAHHRPELSPNDGRTGLHPAASHPSQPA
jgi:nitroimidazol reductase NimA-like FMN-containing flavoprotein (pyridoxamine 5'-phosphate oxidase superfamily)